MKKVLLGLMVLTLLVGCQVKEVENCMSVEFDGSTTTQEIEFGSADLSALSASTVSLSAWIYPDDMGYQATPDQKTGNVIAVGTASGFVLFLLGAGFQTLYTFIGISALAMVFYRPKREEMEQLAKTYEQRGKKTH